tara:strand:+ start:783 stop:989 length:207 start_codon:yes stop_codon:yes gene_type:complete
MTQSEKIQKLIEANSKLRGELFGISGSCAGIAQWTDDERAKENFKKIEERLDSALEIDGKEVDKIIFG